MIANDGSGNNHIFHLYVREKDPKVELWDGARSGTQAAMDVFNADEVCSAIRQIRVILTDHGYQTGDIERIKDILPSILSDATEVYTDIKAFDSSRSILSRYLYGSAGESDTIKKLVDPRKVKPLRPVLNEMRLFKSESEVVNMRLAGQASGRAFTDSMRGDFTREKDLNAFLQYQFKANGCDGTAFVPVVAGGRVSVSVPVLPNIDTNNFQNALSIHYTRNDDVLR